MMKLNLYYIAVVLLGILLLYILRPDVEQEVSFYGFAESNETEINYNHSVVVEKIWVTPGQAVAMGDTLMFLTRRKSREVLEDQNFKIAELKAKESIRKQGIESKIKHEELDRDVELSQISQQITTLRNELKFRRSLTEGLSTLDTSQASFNPIQNKIDRLENERKTILETYNQQIVALQDELQLGNEPGAQEIQRLQAIQEFEESQQVIPIYVTAPTEGLIGTITCKEEEHIASYNTLLTFYEPHSGVIKGYVHEDLTLQVNVGDKGTIASLKNSTISYQGEVIGLGSRIVEIPSRLRKIPDLKSYGREVLLQIDKNNSFLQKEKVSINLIASSESL